MVCMQSLFLQPRVGEFILIRAEEVVPTFYHLLTLLMYPLRQASAPSILLPRSEVAGHVFHVMIFQRHYQLFLTLVSRFLQPPVKVAHQDDLKLLPRLHQPLLIVMYFRHVVWGHVCLNNLPFPRPRHHQETHHVEAEIHRPFYLPSHPFLTCHYVPPLDA